MGCIQRRNDLSIFAKVKMLEEVLAPLVLYVTDSLVLNTMKRRSKEVFTMGFRNESQGIGIGMWVQEFIGGKENIKRMNEERLAEKY